jgi:mono/diheme cytochrome c family protein
MRTAILFPFVLGALMLPAQQTAPKVSKVGAVPTSPASGKEMFHAYCASCHGVDGKGNGPATPALTKHPGDLSIMAKQSGGKFPAMRVMSRSKMGLC